MFRSDPRPSLLRPGPGPTPAENRLPDHAHPNSPQTSGLVFLGLTAGLSWGPPRRLARNRPRYTRPPRAKAAKKVSGGLRRTKNPRAHGRYNSRRPRTPGNAARTGPDPDPTGPEKQTLDPATASSHPQFLTESPPSEPDKDRHETARQKTVRTAARRRARPRPLIVKTSHSPARTREHGPEKAATRRPG
jgi:hypothetical protein